MTLKAQDEDDVVYDVADGVTELESDDLGFDDYEDFYKNGEGTLVYSGKGTWSGNTVVNAGTLRLSGGSNRLSLSMWLIVKRGATLDLNDQYQGAGLASFYSGSILDLGAGTFGLPSWPGSIGDTFIGGTVIGTGGLWVDADRGLELHGNNSFSGGVSVGFFVRLNLYHNNALGSGTLTITRQGVQIKTSDGRTITNNILAQDDFDWLVDANSAATYAGNISESGGSFGLTKTGSGTLYLSGSNTSTGGLTVESGKVVLSGGDNRLSTMSGVTLEGDGILDLNDNNQSLADLDGESGTQVDLGSGTLTLTPSGGVTAAYDGSFSGSGDLVVNGAGMVEISQALGHTGSTTVTAGTLSFKTVDQTFADLDIPDGTFLNLDSMNLNLNAVASNSPQIDGVVSGSGSITHGGTWTVNLTGANTFTGGVKATNSGTLHLAHNQAAGTGNITLAGGPLRIVDGLTVANNIILEGNHTINAQSGTSTLTGVISETGGSRQLSKTGDGIFVLSGANTFSGGLTISGDGAVQLGNAAGAGSGTITISAGSLNLGDQSISNAITLAGGTLTGAGTLNSPTITSGTIAPGNSPGLLSFNDALTLNAATIIEIELGGTTRGSQYDAIDVNGILTQASTLTVTLIDSFSPSSSDSFQLFDATSIGGSFATTNLPTLSEGLSWNTDNLASTGTISVTGSAVPEPATFSTLLGLFAIGFTAVRRRR